MSDATISISILGVAGDIAARIYPARESHHLTFLRDIIADALTRAEAEGYRSGQEAMRVRAALSIWRRLHADVTSLHKADEIARSIRALPFDEPPRE